MILKLNNLLVLLIFFIIGKSSLNAQIIIIKDDRIDALIDDKVKTKLVGFRIQICFDSDKNIVNAARTKFSNLYPRIDTYMNFEAPNFNLLVGDFRTRIEAEKLLEKILGEFTITIIRKEYIHLPRVD
jgi:hypothetical protein